VELVANSCKITSFYLKKNHSNENYLKYLHICRNLLPKCSFLLKKLYFSRLFFF
jgi:hypothetical protein